MVAQYLFDEHFPAAFKDALVREDPTIMAWMIGDLGAPPRGTPDPDILRWCEARGVMLITNDRTTMPVHLAEHVARGGHLLGMFIVSPSRNIGLVIDDLVLVAGAAREDEFRDQVTYLPLE